ncbi:MAG: type II toxin-antitoxin system VapC family toxin [Pseudonocardiales bacterium]|nr:type II toxin-antitoxin system VapC family toxin [Pseudonocardiales bacterium]
MTVFDASVLVDALVVAGPAGNDAREVLRDRSLLHVPSIFAAEATSAIRAMQARGEVSTGQARGAVSKIKTMRTVQYPFEPFLDRVWELRDNLTVYDGWYVALAESLDTSLVTADRRLAQASGPRCSVMDVARFAARSPGPPAQRSRPE